MIKKVVIAAAGKGTRMLDLVKDRPKHIIPVAGQPFLFYLLSNLKAAGIDKMYLVVGHQKEKMLEFVESVKDKFNIQTIDQFEIIGRDRYGTACAIEAAEQMVGKNDFIAVYGDNLYSVDDIKTLMLEDGFNYIAGYEHSEPERYGVLVEKDGFLQETMEKPAKEIARGHRINTGLYKFKTEIFDVIRSVEKSARGEYELTDAITILAKQGKVKVSTIKDYWYDFGRPEDIDVMHKFINSQRS